MNELIAELSRPHSIKEAMSAGGLPSVPGIYAWWVKNPRALPAVPLTPREGDGLSILYVGLARSRPSSGETLRSRVAGKHLNGVLGNSTFRRSLAALLWESLGWTPRWATDRVAFSDEHNRMLGDWMWSHLLVAWAPHPEPWTVEDDVIAEMQPPLNVKSNRTHAFYKLIKSARGRLTAAGRGTVDGETGSARIAGKVQNPQQQAVITAKELADEFRMDPKDLRKRLRTLQQAGKIGAKDGRWVWQTSSPELAIIRAALGRDS